MLLLGPKRNCVTRDHQTWAVLSLFAREGAVLLLLLLAWLTINHAISPRLGLVVEVSRFSLLPRPLCGR